MRNFGIGYLCLGKIKFCLNLDCAQFKSEDEDGYQIPISNQAAARNLNMNVYVNASLQYEQGYIIPEHPRTSANTRNKIKAAKTGENSIILIFAAIHLFVVT